MASVSIDVELDEFDFEDIIQEVIDNLDGYRAKPDRIKKKLDELRIELGVVEGVKTETIEDVIKNELLVKAFEKYTLNQLQNILKL